MKNISELTLNQLESNYGLDEFNLEDYTLDCLNQNTVDIYGYTHYQGDVLKEIDPIAYRQIELDFLDNLIQDEAVAETKDGLYIWIQDVDLDELELIND